MGAGLAASSAEERVAAQICLAEVPLTRFLEEPLIPYESDEVTRLILDSHDRQAFAPVAGLSVGELRNWLLAYETDGRIAGRCGNRDRDLVPNGVFPCVVEPNRAAR